jgi:phosphoribosylaminoimidazolecarboxamide formyltransferase/IMP cyclohydrolase
MPRALFSVHDKTGLVEFGEALTKLGWDIVASGGTASALMNAKIPVLQVDEVTKHPEILGGRVKTLHPAIHGPILARDLQEDIDTLNAMGYVPIDLVVCNLYPFEKTVAKPDVTLADAVEQIDIGGVTLLRAAAKNFVRVAVVSDPADYARVVTAASSAAGITAELRRALAIKAFEQTRNYDTAIHNYLLAGSPLENASALPPTLSISLPVSEVLRYGENPHQQGAIYTKDSGPLGGEILGGKTLSYNNLLDLDAAYKAVALFTDPTVVIVKHLTPCGISSGSSLAEAFPAALASDPVSAYGGVIAVNETVDEAFVEALGDLFLEAIAAPEFTPPALERLLKKRKNCRLLRMHPEKLPQTLEFRSVRGGVLIQTLDFGDPEGTDWKVVSKRAPTEAELKALHFAWKASQYVKSNAIVLTHEHATVGIGGGLPSRVDAAKIAVEKAGEKAKGSVMASDAFFPFPDSVEVGVAAGITAIVCPGGSIRDNEVIAAADAANIAMLFTGVRHFRH